MSDNSFLVVSDEHLEDALFNLPELGQDLFDVYEEAVDKAIELRVKYFISVGDLFETNKPNQSTIDFVVNLNRKLIKNNITPLALAGDHSKPVDGITWESICGFYPIDTEPTFVGFNYDDNAELLRDKVLTQLSNRKEYTEFIFLHTQISSMFGFPEDKKNLKIDWNTLVKELPKLKGCIFGDIHSGISKKVEGLDYFGYCGSLGVTALDEIREKHYIHWDGKKINLVEHELTRQFFEFDLTEETIQKLDKEKEIKELQESFARTGKKPVYLIHYHKQLYKHLLDFSFLNDLAIVRTSILPQEGQVNLNINIRSEISNHTNLNEVFELVLKENGTFDLEINDLGIKLLDSLINNNTKEVLNELKKKYIP